MYATAVIESSTIGTRMYTYQEYKWCVKGAKTMTQKFLTDYGIRISFKACASSSQAERGNICVSDYQTRIYQYTASS
jgi:hypothetical protein